MGSKQAGGGATTNVAGPVLKRIGKNLRRLRGERTQAEFSTQTKLGQPVISRIETGSYAGLDIEGLVRLALSLGVSLDDLLDGVDMAMDIVRYEQKDAAA